MKRRDTIFEVGMEVYDSLNYPNQKGKVVEIKESYDIAFSYPVVVKFDGIINEKLYSEEGVIAGSLSKTLSTKPYEVKLENFEQKSPVPTYENAVKWVENNKNYNPAYVDINEEEKVFLSKEYFYAFDSLRKLIILMEYYNEGWRADWNNDKQMKYTIEYFMYEIWCDDYTTAKKILSFKTPEIRDKFLEEQKELLEIAKPIL